MEMLSALWMMLFGFFPSWMQLALGGILALAVVFMVMRFTAFVLDTIPFM